MLRVVSRDNAYEFSCRIWGKMPHLGPEDFLKYSLLLLLFIHSVLASCKTSKKYLEWVPITKCGSLWAQSGVKSTILKSISVLPKYLFSLQLQCPISFYISYDHYMIILNFRKIFRLESKNNIYKVMDPSWGKTNRSGNYTSFFKSIHYCHFCLWCSDTIQNFRKIIRMD